MRLIVAVMSFLFFVPGALWANDLVPERRLAMTSDVDFYGSDLQALFDTSFQACQKACLLDKRCNAFTFNTRSNACFPKSEVSEAKPYQGAVSARVFQTPRQVLARAAARAGDLTFLSDGDFAAARDLAEKLATYHYANEWSAQALLETARERQRRSVAGGAQLHRRRADADRRARSMGAIRTSRSASENQ